MVNAVMTVVDSVARLSVESVSSRLVFAIIDSVAVCMSAFVPGMSLILVSGYFLFSV